MDQLETTPVKPITQLGLPPQDVLEIILLPDNGAFCIGGNIQGDALVLLRGNLDTLVVPLSSFKPTGSGVAPDFSDFEIIDYGKALRFGKYEADFDAVLQESGKD